MPSESSRTISSRLRERAVNYFPELAGQSLRVRLLRTSHRAFATLYELEVNGDELRRAVIVKITSDADHVSGGRLHGPGDPAYERFLPRPDAKGYECAALRSIQQHFAALNDARFGAVRVLDEWFDGWGIVMEKLPYPTLANLLRQSARCATRRADSVTWLRNCGAWLREFHRSVPPVHTTRRDISRESFCEEIAELSGLLRSSCSPRNQFLCLLDQLKSRAHAILPRELPSGVTHGDFASRNVLVARTGTVTVLDTLAERQAAIYEDIAHFLVNLKTNKLQMLSLGCAFDPVVLHRHEQDLLRGYFGQEEYRTDLIRLFEWKTALTRWAVMHLQQKQLAGLSRIKHGTYLVLFDRFLKCHFQQHSSEPRQRNGWAPADAKTERQRRMLYTLNDRARDYFPETDLSEARIVLERVAKHQFSTIFPFTLVAGDERRRIVVKVPKNSYDTIRNGPFADRPRLTPLLPPAEEACLEFTALSHMSRHFQPFVEDGLRAVRPYDLLPDEPAVVMEAIPCPTLEDWIIRQAGKHRDWQSVDFALALRRAGQWLRRFHRMPAVKHRGMRHKARTNFIESVSGYANFLMERIGGPDVVRPLTEAASRLAISHLPEQLPLGTAHNDYAPHNLFVWPDSSVAAFDTLAHWQAPIYEDLAHFLVVLRANCQARRARHVTPRTFSDFENQFLAGYFGNEEVPRAAIRLFQVLVTLDKWSSAAFSHQRTRGIRKFVKGWLLGRRSLVFRNELQSLLAEIDGQSLARNSRINAKQNIGGIASCP